MHHVWINHDTDLLDVTLHTADGQQAVAATSDAKQRAVALRAHGLRAPPDDQVDLTRRGTTVGAVAGVAQDETVHTTANHPWLTTDRGWVPAGELRSGEPIVREGGAAPATVTALRVVAGAADYYNLTVSVLHTYAVGDGQYVVHNCGDTGNGYIEGTDPPKTQRVPGNSANKVPGQVNLYNGQGVDEFALSTDGWTVTDNTPLSVNTSDQFNEFIRSKYPNEPVSDWKYKMQTWTSPKGQTVESHYWENPFGHRGEAYHHH